VLGFRDVKVLNENMKRYIENFFRQEFDFTGVSVRIEYSEPEKQEAK
jgi:predicted GTPase